MILLLRLVVILLCAKWTLQSKLEIELNSISISATAGFLKDLAVSQNTSQSCRADLNSVFRDYAKSNSSMETLFLSASAYGTKENYWHINQPNWVYKSLSCQVSAGGTPFTQGKHYQFCMTDLNDETVMGFCVPESCLGDSQIPLEKLENLVNSSEIVVNSEKKQQSFDCLAAYYEKPFYEKPTVMLDFAIQIAVITMFVSSGIYEWRLKSRTNLSLLQRIYLAFSMRQNWKRITEMPANLTVTISCVFGIRFWSTIWTIVGHSYAFVLGFMPSDVEYRKEMQNGFFALIFTNFTLCTDTFFLLSGALTSYAFFRKMGKTPQHKQPSWFSIKYWFHFYFHRWIRLFPTYAFVVMSVTFRFAKLHYHPLWPFVDPDLQCRKHWWENLLFLNNLLPPFCLPWTWYLACDWQFYLLSPIFMLLLHKKPTLGFSTLVGITSLSMMTRSALIYAYNLPPILSVYNTPSMFNANFITYQLNMYIRPYNRIGPYLLGLGLGYILAHAVKTRLPMVRLSPMQRVTGWFLAFLALAWGLFGAYPAMQGWDTVAWKIYYSLYGASNKVVFTAGVAWIIFACHTGHGKLLNRLLSFRIWFFLSNLSYSVYLLHVLLVIGAFLLGPFPFHWTGHPKLLLYTLIQIILTYIGCLPVVLGIEMPAVNIERVLMDEKQSRKAQNVAEAAPKDDDQQMEMCVVGETEVKQTSTGSSPDSLSLTAVALDEPGETGYSSIADDSISDSSGHSSPSDSSRLNR